MNRRKAQGRIRYSVVMVFMLIIAVGSVAGSYGELKIDTDFRNGAMEYIDKAVAYDDTVDKFSVFKESFKNNGKLLLIMGAGGLTVVLFPAVFAVALYKGVSIGFTSALMMEGNGKEGVINCCGSLLLHNCIFIAMIIIYGYFTVCMAIDVIKCRNKRKKKEIYIEELKLFILFSGEALLLLMIGAAAEAYINPLIMGII